MQSLGVCFDYFFLKEEKVLLPWSKPGRCEENGTRIRLSTALCLIIRD